MTLYVRAAKRFLFDENAAEITELAIVLVLIVAGAIVLIASLGETVQRMFEDTDNALPS
jgi:Flp pilus assembly pilin Flp